MAFIAYSYLNLYFSMISTNENIWGEYHRPPTPPQWWPWWKHTSGGSESPQWLIWFSHSSHGLLALATQSSITVGFGLQLASRCKFRTTLWFTFLLGYARPSLHMFLPQRPSDSLCHRNCQPSLTLLPVQDTHFPPTLLTHRPLAV